MESKNSEILLKTSIEILEKYEDILLLLEEIKKKNYKLSDIGISARVVSHWRKSDILFDEDEKSSKNKMARFNLSQIFWLKVIKKMIKFGVPISSIYTLKQIITIDKIYEFVDSEIDELIESYKKEKPEDLELIEEFKNYIKKNGSKSMLKSSLSSFDILLLIALVTRNNTGIIVTEEEEVVFRVEDLHEYIPSELNDTHLYISFNNILAELGLKQELKNNNIYSEKEKDIIKQIREDKVISVKVIIKKKSPTSTQVKYEVENKIPMVDLYFKHSKDDVKFFPENGKKRKIIITTHNKL